MNTKNIVIVFFLLITTYCTNFLHAANASPLANPSAKSMPPMTPDDIKMLQEVEQEINKFVGSLPADEQKKFWAEVDELSKVMSTMNEDELVKFMENVLQEQEGQKPAPLPMPKPMPVAPIAPAPLPIEKVEEPKVPLESYEKQQQAVKLIEAIIIMLNNFMTKVQALPDFPGKVESWLKEGKVKGFKQAHNWNSLRIAIESLIAQLNKIKDHDPNTGKYKYLDEVITQEGLINNLKRLKTVLSEYEPHIDISPFGLEKMNQKTRTAVRAVLNSVIEAITILDIPETLNRIIEKYEPFAKQLREKEELAQKRALESGKYPAYPTPVTVAGKGQERERLEREFAKFDFGKAPYKPAPIPAPTKEKEAAKKPEEKAAAPEGGKGKDAGKPADKKDEKKEEKKLEEDDKEAYDTYKKFSESLFKLSMMIEDRIDEINKEKLDQEGIQELATAAQSMRQTLFDLRQLKRRLAQLEKTKPYLKKTYKKLLEDVMKENKKLFEDFAKISGSKYQENIDKINEKIDTIKELLKKMFGT